MTSKCFVYGMHGGSCYGGTARHRENPCGPCLAAKAAEILEGRGKVDPKKRFADMVKSALITEDGKLNRRDSDE